MFRYWLISSLRFLARDRAYSLINLGGITIGLAVVLIMGVYVADEFGYDRHLADPDNSYLVVYDEPRPDGSFERCGIVGGGMVKALPGVFPEVEAAARTTMIGPLEVKTLDPQRGWSESTMTLNLFRAEASLFDIFPYKVLQGDSANMLETATNVVLTRSTAEKLFGNKNPLGRQIAIDPVRPYTVTAVIEDLPRKSHLQFDVLLPLIDSPDRYYWADFESWAITGYVRLRPGADTRALELGIDKLVDENTEIQEAKAYLVPIKDLHLHAAHFVWMRNNIDLGDYNQVVLLALIASVILLIAAFNYINLTTARATIRAREVGLRKTVGATRGSLILHYLGESMILVMLSLVLAMIIGEIAMPYAGDFLGKDLSAVSLFRPGTIAVIIPVALLIGALAGIYPGLVLSSFSPINALRTQKTMASTRSGLRRTIVVLQFSVAIVLLITVMVIRSQLSYLSKLDMGYDREQTVMVLFDQEWDKQSLLDRVDTFDEVASVSTANGWPGRDAPESYIALDGWSEDALKNMSFKKMNVGHDWFSLLGIELLEGRLFREGSQDDVENSIILNETAARMSGWEDPVGKWVQFFQDEKKYVVGIVRDFQFGSARIAVPPVAISYDPIGTTSLMFVKLKPGKTVEGMKKIEEAYAEYVPGQLFNYTFLDERFDQLYRSDRVFARNVALYSGLAIFISALGLFGLTAFTTERRKREVAVRKVLGASESGLVTMLSREMLMQVALANVIAWPVAWIIMSKWMESFISRQAMPVWPYLLSALLVLTFAGLTISALVVGIARRNPVNSLRSE